MQILSSLAILATAASTVQAVGNAIIYNRCARDVYVWPTDAERWPTDPIVIKAGSSYQESYVTPSSGGVSLKLSNTPQMLDGKITQFEYTVATFGDTSLWYDGSNVNCQDSNCPFYNDGIYLKTSKSTCPTRVCPIGAVCTGFYTVFDDDENSLACDVAHDTSMYLCALSDSGSAPAQSNPAPSSSAAPTVVVSSSSSAAPVASSSSPVSVPVSSATSSATSSRTSSATSSRTSSATSSRTSSATPSTISSAVSTSTAKSTSSTAVQMNEAPVTTLVTVTRYRRPFPTKRAEAHAHARRHQHQN